MPDAQLTSHGGPALGLNAQGILWALLAYALFAVCCGGRNGQDRVGRIPRIADTLLRSDCEVTRPAYEALSNRRIKKRYAIDQKQSLDFMK